MTYIGGGVTLSDILQSSELNVHDILVNLAKQIQEEEVAVLASGGIDSWSVVFALLEVGKKVHIYSFTLDDRESYDFTKARELSQIYGLKFTPIILPTDISVLKRDVLLLSDKYNCIKKTDFECLWPFLYAYGKIEETVIGSGLCADGYFCISKSGVLHFKDKMDEFRKRYFDNNGSQHKHHYFMAEQFNKKLFMPYNTPEMFSYFVGTTWDQCNKPRQKQPIFNSYITEFKSNNFKKHSNLQLGDSGISEHFDKLLKTDWNIYNYMSVTGIFNLVNKGVVGRGKTNGKQTNLF